MSEGRNTNDKANEKQRGAGCAVFNFACARSGREVGSLLPETRLPENLGCRKVDHPLHGEAAMNPTVKTPVANQTPQRIGAGLYRRGGTIFARIRENGKRTWRSTNTSDLTTARKILKAWREQQVLSMHGVEPAEAALNRNRLTVDEVLKAYAKAGCPTRKLQPKSPATVRNELAMLNPLRRYFGERAAVTLKLADCDLYRDWRNAGGYKIERKLKNGEPTKRKTCGGDRGVDLELTTLSNALTLAVRRGELKANPLRGRTAYTVAANVRHCREVAPTPRSLAKIIGWLRGRNETAIADLVAFLAYSGLRIGEALPLTWQGVNLGEGLVNVKREKRGVNPWVAITPELDMLLRDMQRRAASALLFPSPQNPGKPRERRHCNRRIKAACRALGLPHVTPHGLRSFYVTQCRQSGLTDSEIAMLIGDKSGAAIIAHTYGDLRDDHLLAQARRVRHTIAPSNEGVSVIPEVIPACPQESPRTDAASVVSTQATRAA
jgi:integrase